MVYRFGWFSTGRDEAANELLAIVVDAILRGVIPAEISYIFCNRERGESPESDRFIQLAGSLGIPVVLLSSRDFLPSLHQEDREQWRIQYHEEVAKRVRDFSVNMIVLAGYMLIVSPAFCEEFSLINLHPAAPGGPKGTWQEVIWALIQEKSAETGIMIHLVTKDLDEGPPITFVNFPIQDGNFRSLWKDFDRRLKNYSFDQLVKGEIEDSPLFREIRRQGVRRELPLLVMTLKALAEGRVRIERGKVLNAEGAEIKGICLNEEVQEYLKNSSE
jgi:phosphoribosylglycinamide formyltransferase-1